MTTPLPMRPLPSNSPPAAAIADPTASDPIVQVTRRLGLAPTPPTWVLTFHRGRLVL
ncbi:hypothetical protein LV779_33965 [Streptomyces thinghirensis]|nr:hypothetical protein [Streptomyces thinghirensis]